MSTQPPEHELTAQPDFGDDAGELTSQPDFGVEATSQPDLAIDLTRQPDFGDATGQPRLAPDPAGRIGKETRSRAWAVGDMVTLSGLVQLRIELALPLRGEAEAYVVSAGGVRRVLKLYVPPAAPNAAVLQTLRSAAASELLGVLEFGQHEGRAWELSPLAEGGTLGDTQVRDILALMTITRQTAAAIGRCHRLGFVHGDVKPENLFFLNAARTHLVLGDYGTASPVLDEGYTLPVKARRTDVYAAPEQFYHASDATVRLSPAADYYALGISLLWLWLGRPPVGTNHEALFAKRNGTVPLPADLPARWSNLIRGLLTPAESGRFAAPEIERWLAGEDVQPRGSAPRPGALQYPPFAFGLIGGSNLIAHTPEELAGLCHAHPERGMDLLYRQLIVRWLETSNPGLCVEIQHVIEREHPRDQLAGLKRAIYLLDRTRGFDGVDGSVVGSPAELAAHLSQHTDHYAAELANTNSPLYLWQQSRGRDDMSRSWYSLFRDLPPRRALNTVILGLEGGSAYNGSEGRFANINELLSTGPEVLSRAADALADADSKLSVWVLASGADASRVEQWRLMGRRDAVTLPYAFGAPLQLGNDTLTGSHDVRRALREEPSAVLGAAAAVDDYLSAFEGADIAQLCQSELGQADSQLADPIALFERAVMLCAPEAVPSDPDVTPHALALCVARHLRGASFDKARFAEAARHGWKRWASPCLPASDSSGFVHRFKLFAIDAERHAPTHPSLWRELALALDPFVLPGVREDLDSILAARNPSLATDALLAARDACLCRLKGAVGDLPVHDRVARDVVDFAARQPALKQRIAAEVEARHAALRARMHREVEAELQRLRDGYRPLGTRRLVGNVIGLGAMAALLITGWEIPSGVTDQLARSWIVLTICAVVGLIISVSANTDDVGEFFAAWGCFSVITLMIIALTAWMLAGAGLLNLAGVVLTWLSTASIIALSRHGLALRAKAREVLSTRGWASGFAQIDDWGTIELADQEQHLRARLAREENGLTI